MYSVPAIDSARKFHVEAHHIVFISIEGITNENATDIPATNLKSTQSGFIGLIFFKILSLISEFVNNEDATF